MVKYILTVLLVAFVATGCATQATVDIVESHNDAYEIHQIMESEKVATKAERIAELLAYECDDGTEACGVAKALAGVVAADKIANIKGDPFTLKRHKTELDVQSEALETVGKGIPFATVGIVSYKAIAENNGTVINDASEGGTITTDRVENHTTTLGDENNVVSKEPVVIEKEVPSGEPEGDI